MPFLRQAFGVKLRPYNAIPYRSANIIRFASHSNKHKKSHAARDAEAKVFHNEAGRGKRQKSFRKFFAPDFVTQETNASSASDGHFTQASAFKLYASHSVGSKPIVEASSASWNSSTNEISHTVYDPISGRMVPANDGQSRQDSTTVKTQKDKAPTTHASLTEDFDKSYHSEHDELLAARRHLDTLREQIQILERQTHPEMVKPHYAVDAERPAVFEGGWDDNPKGLQTAFKLEKAACEHGQMESLEQEMDALNKTHIQEISDDYSVAPSGMETLFADEKNSDDIGHRSSLEQELVAMNTVPVDGGYSPSPQGLETLFEQEQYSTAKDECKTLEDEVLMTGSAAVQPQYVDGFAKEPTGLETMFKQEQQGTPQTLEHELESMASKPASSDPNDAYSNTSAFGMETHFRDEAQRIQDSGRSLGEDLKQMEEASYHEDGYSCAPIGMENSFEKEVKDESTSLEADLNMPGEGDLSPTVGKFANRAQWYKQPARSTFSEDYLKAEVRKPDQQTALSGHSLDDKSNVPTPETTITTEHSSTPTTSTNDPLTSSLAPESGSNIQWREPALYKVIAYDSSKDTVTITNTPSKFSDSEIPLSIPQAISQLTLAARFIPHIAASQNEGYQVIHAEKDYLVSRLVHKGLDSKASGHEAVTNPIDGTTRYTPVEPPSARFASPTGFVNYEPILPTEPMHNRQKTRRNIFRHADAKYRKEKRRRWRRRIAWVTSVTAGTAVCTVYVVGVSSELAKSENRIAQPTR